MDQFENNVNDNADESVFGEQSFVPQNTPHTPQEQYPQGQYVQPQIPYQGVPSQGNMQYRQMYSSHQQGVPRYREYTPPPQNNQGMYGYNPAPAPAPAYSGAEIPSVSDIPQTELKKSSKAWIIALIIGVILLLAGIMIILAMSNSEDGGSASSGLTASSGSGVEVNINVQPKPVENEEYYQNKETGLLTTVGAANTVLPSIVNIYGYTDTVLAPYNEASGVIISEDGYIITNAHAVEDVRRVKIRLSDDSEYEARIVGIDTKTDLAVLKTDAEGLTPAVLGDASMLMQGEQVIAIGNASGYNNTVTVGYVSHTDREIKSYTGYNIRCVQTDAVLNFGNSGGALINLYGQVVGIVTSKYSSTGNENVGFAIRTDFAVPIAEDIIENGFVTGRPRVGVIYQLITAEIAAQLEVKPGMLINEIAPECDIANTGLQKDDIITELDGTQILTDADIKNFQESHSPGDSVTAKVYRKSITGEVTEFEITFRLEENAE